MKIRIIAKAGARTTRVDRIDADTLRVSVMEPPVSGRANAAIISAVAAYLRIPETAVRLLSGASSKYKYVVVP
jgi:uncharacterized protein YggU (UPF0235/DUF167 family)